MNTDSQKSVKRQYSRQHDRNDLVGEHPQGDLGQIFLLFIFLTVWGLDSFLLKYSIWLNSIVPDVLQIILGSLIGIIAGLMAWKTMGTIFGEKRDPPAVVSAGIYGFCRHPMYLAAILFYLSCLAFSMSIMGAVIVVGVIIFYNYIGRYEERKLMAFFGEKYVEYMKKVPRWGLKRKVNRKNEKE